MVFGRRCGAAVAAVALALAGCSDDKKGTEAAACKGSTTTSAGAPAGRVVTNAADGFSIQIPNTWKDVVVDNTTIQKLFNEPDENKLPDAILNQVRTLIQRGGKLFAYDECERTTNLNVLKIPSAPGLTTEKVAEGLPGQLGELGLRDVKVEVANIAAGPAAKASGVQSVKDGQQKDVDLLQIQYYLVSGASTFITILATDDPGRDQPTLEAIGASFQLTQPAAPTPAQ